MLVLCCSIFMRTEYAWGNRTLRLGLPHIVNDLTGDLGGTYMISPVG
jgi:hypothetical protein